MRVRFLSCGPWFAASVICSVCLDVSDDSFVWSVVCGSYFQVH